MHFNFTTLFFSNYSAKGVALYRSLERVCDDFHMYIFAMDSACESILRDLNLKYATILTINELETDCPALLSVKDHRNKGEYSWTCKGPSLLYCINHFHLKDCTYLDADLYFLKDPTPIYQECPKADVMLTDHRYTDQYNLAATNGKYCAGYMYFKATENGMKILRWWTDQCIKWCFSTHEPGRFGDQKYLDLFHEYFDNVYDIQHIGYCAPWNIQQYSVLPSSNGINVRLGNITDELIFYHYHFIHNQDMGKFNELNIGPYAFDDKTIQYIYKPYMMELEEFTKECDSKGSGVDVLASMSCPMNTTQFLWHWIKNCWKSNKYIWRRR